MSGVRCENRYRMVRVLGSGSFGEIRVARDVYLQREVALKIIHATFAQDAWVVERFMTEAETLADLEHPHIIPIHDSGRLADGRPFFSMRLVEGATLESLATEFQNENRRTSPIIKYRSDGFVGLIKHLANAAEAISFAHQNCVVHRDIKPSNILISHNQETFVVDWGTARNSKRPRTQQSPPLPTNDSVDAHTVENERPRDTVHGMILGTPSFMSPEQACGRNDDVTEKSDIYSLGASLYFILTGQPPHHGSQLTEVIDQAKQGQVPDVLTLAPDAPKRLVEICRRSLHVNPNKRFPDAAAFVSELIKFVDEAQGPPTFPPPIAGESKPTPQRRSDDVGIDRWKVATLTLASLMLVVAAVGTTKYLWDVSRLREQIQETPSQVEKTIRTTPTPNRLVTHQLSSPEDESDESADPHASSSFNEYERSLEDLERQLLEYQSSLQAQQDELTMLSEYRKGDQLRIDELEQSNLQLNEQLRTQENNIASQASEVVAAREAQLETTAERDEILAQLSETTESLEEAIRDRDRWQQSWDELRDTQRDADEMIPMLQLSVQDLTEDVQAAEVELSNTRYRLIAAEAQLEDESRRRQQLESELDSAREAINEANQTAPVVVSTGIRLDQIHDFLASTAFQPADARTERSLMLRNVHPTQRCQLSLARDQTIVLTVNTRAKISAAELNAWNSLGNGVTAYTNSNDEVILEALFLPIGGLIASDVAALLERFHLTVVDFHERFQR